MAALTVWLEFGLALALIYLAGSRLAHYGDVIAERTGLGGTWVGLILIATVTSLPELITGVSAVTLTDAPDIAVGEILGSCVFNLVIIVVLDYLLRGAPLYTRVGQNHVLAAGCSILLIGVVGFNLLLEGQGKVVTFGHIGLYTPIILALYLFSVRAVFRYEKASPISDPATESAADSALTLHGAGLRYAGAALVVVATGLWLPFVGQDMARVMGVQETFVGSLFIAFATSLPEVVVTIAAMRLGALNMAMSNLFGSNLFNILILVPLDAVYTKGSILGLVSPLHTISAVSAIMMTGLAIVGLMYRSPRLLFQRIGWGSMVLLAIYLLNFYVLYLYE